MNVKQIILALCMLALLMGCASGKVKFKGNYDDGTWDGKTKGKIKVENKYKD